MIHELRKELPVALRTSSGLPQLDPHYHISDMPKRHTTRDVSQSDSLMAIDGVDLLTDAEFSLYTWLHALTPDQFITLENLCGPKPIAIDKLLSILHEYVCMTFPHLSSSTVLDGLRDALSSLDTTTRPSPDQPILLSLGDVVGWYLDAARDKSAAEEAMQALLREGLGLPPETAKSAPHTMYDASAATSKAKSTVHKGTTKTKEEEHVIGLHILNHISAVDLFADVVPDLVPLDTLGPAPPRDVPKTSSLRYSAPRDVPKTSSLRYSALVCIDTNEERFVGIARSQPSFDILCFNDKLTPGGIGVEQRVHLWDHKIVATAAMALPSQAVLVVGASDGLLGLYSTIRSNVILLGTYSSPWGSSAAIVMSLAVHPLFSLLLAGDRLGGLSAHRFEKQAAETLQSKKQSGEGTSLGEQEGGDNSFIRSQACLTVAGRSDVHRQAVTAILCVPASAKVAVGSVVGDIAIVQLPHGSVIARCAAAHNGPVRTLSYCIATSTILSGGTGSHPVALYETRFQELAAHQLRPAPDPQCVTPTKSSLVYITMVNDGAQLLCVDNYGVCRIWDAATLECLFMFTAPPYMRTSTLTQDDPSVSAALHFPRLQRLVVVTVGGLYVYQSNDKVSVATRCAHFPVPSQPIVCAAYNATHDVILTAAGRDIKIWSASTGSLKHFCSQILPVPITCIYFDASGDRFAVGGVLEESMYTPYVDQSESVSPKKSALSNAQSNRPARSGVSWSSKAHDKVTDNAQSNLLVYTLGTRRFDRALAVPENAAIQTVSFATHMRAIVAITVGPPLICVWPDSDGSQRKSMKLEEELRPIRCIVRQPLRGVPSSSIWAFHVGMICVACHPSGAAGVTPASVLASYDQIHSSTKVIQPKALRNLEKADLGASLGGGKVGTLSSRAGRRASIVSAGDTTDRSDSIGPRSFFVDLFQWGLSLPEHSPNRVATLLLKHKVTCMTLLEPYPAIALGDSSGGISILTVPPHSEITELCSFSCLPTVMGTQNTSDILVPSVLQWSFPYTLLIGTTAGQCLRADLSGVIIEAKLVAVCVPRMSALGRRDSILASPCPVNFAVQSVGGGTIAIKAWKAHTSGVVCLSLVYPSGLLTAGLDHMVQIWSLRDDICVGSLKQGLESDWRFVSAPPHLRALYAAKRASSLGADPVERTNIQVEDGDRVRGADIVRLPTYNPSKWTALRASRTSNGLSFRLQSQSDPEERHSIEEQKHPLPLHNGLGTAERFLRSAVASNPVLDTDAAPFVSISEVDSIPRVNKKANGDAALSLERSSVVYSSRLNGLLWDQSRSSLPNGAQPVQLPLDSTDAIETRVPTHRRGADGDSTEIVAAITAAKVCQTVGFDPFSFSGPRKAALSGPDAQRLQSEAALTEAVHSAHLTALKSLGRAVVMPRQLIAEDGRDILPSLRPATNPAAAPIVEPPAAASSVMKALQLKEHAPISTIVEHIPQSIRRLMASEHCRTPRSASPRPSISPQKRIDSARRRGYSSRPVTSKSISVPSHRSVSEVRRVLARSRPVTPRIASSNSESVLSLRNVIHT